MDRSIIANTARLLGYKVVPPDGHDFIYQSVISPEGNPIYERCSPIRYAKSLDDIAVVEHMHRIYGVDFSNG